MMNKIYKLFLITICILSITFHSTVAQKYNEKVVISSTLTDESGKALKGIEILNNRGTVIASTDESGYFSVEVPKNSILQIEHKGYQNQILSAESVSGKLILKSLPFLMDENDRVSVLFGEIKQREIVGAMSTIVPSEVLKYDNARNISEIMNGRMLGMLSAGNMRGIGSPLFLVDGLPRDIDNLNIEEIDRITVMKDANSSILYGTQAANGIVQITTKKGQPYRQKLNIIAETGLATPVVLPEYLSSAEYMEYRNQAAINDGLNAPFSQETIDLYASGKTPYRYPDIDYYSSEFLKKHIGTSKINAEFSGGNRITRYYANLGWINQGTLYKIGDAANTKYNRFNARSNIDINVTDFIQAYIGMTAIFDISKNPVGNFWSDAAKLHPHRYPQLLPVSLISDAVEISDGSALGNATLINDKYILGGTTIYRDNVYGNQSFGNYSTNINRTMQYTQGLNVDLNRYVPGLSLNAAVSFDIYNIFTQSVNNDYAVYEPTWMDYPSGTDSIVYLTKVGSDLKRGTQSISNQYFRRRTNVYISVDYYRNLGVNHHFAGTFLGFYGQLKEENVLIPEKTAHFGLRLSYNYVGKYFADFNGAYVNGYKLSSGNKGSFSPSLGLAWLISEENFLSNIRFIDLLKIRASAGLINFEPGGTDYTLYLQTFGTYNGSFGWDDGNRSLTTRTLNRAANKSLGFQKAKNLNFGLEGYLFNKAFHFDANVFFTRKSDLIIQRSTYPAYMAKNIPYENYNATAYRGIEAGVVWKIGDNNWGFDLGANFLYSTSERIRYDEAQPESYMNRKGKSADAMFGLEAIGLFDSWESIQNNPEQAFTTVQPGDIQYKDQNNDGVINENDVVCIGNSQARIFFGVSALAKYKNFSLFVLGTGRQGGYSYNNSSYYWIQGEDKYSKEVLNSWTEETKDIATYPRMSYGNNTNNFRNSTFWLYKNDFFRLERIQLNYTLPANLSHTLFAKDIRAYIRGENLLRISQDAKKRQLNIGGEPNYRYFLLGLTVMF